MSQLSLSLDSSLLVRDDQGRKLRLGPLPKTESVKLTFVCPAGLKADLDRYVALHAQTYGETVDAATLIPHMLEAFMAGDRGFRKGGTPKSAPPAPQKPT